MRRVGRVAWLLFLCQPFVISALQQQSAKDTAVFSTSSIPYRPSFKLLQVASCVPGCAPDGCSLGPLNQATCWKCSAGLTLLDKAAGTCGCLAGYYIIDGKCAPCSKSFWCPGGPYAPVEQTVATAAAAAAAAAAADSSAAQPRQVACPEGMTTEGRFQRNPWGCVNLPGFYYVADASWPLAVQCQVDTFCPGLRKQRAGVPCPTGFSTSGLKGQTSSHACVIPAGSYLVSPGQVSLCPRGQFKAATGPASNCSRCPEGVTTLAEGAQSADACSVLLPGFYAATVSPRGAVTASLCPQRFWCPGGVPRSALGFDPEDPTGLWTSEDTIKRCTAGTWTQEMGATSPGQCLTPPGHYTAGGTTLPCPTGPTGSFRTGWAAGVDASSCVPCGEGMLADTLDVVVIYDTVTGAPSEVPVATSPEHCYMRPGQGLYPTVDGTLALTVKNCDNSSFGPANRTYGLAPAPCVDCEDGLVARQELGYAQSNRYFVRHADGAGGFVSAQACVTLPGFGYDSNAVVSPCDKGAYSEGGGLTPCKKCAAGFTTEGLGAGKALSDCLPAAGFDKDGTLCPIGTFNEGTNLRAAVPCSPCPPGTTTGRAGSISAASCTLCQAGHGGEGCTSCGGRGEAASFGPPGRSTGIPCSRCSDLGPPTSYNFQVVINGGLTNDVFAPGPIAPQNSTRAVDCLAEYTQIKDDWHLSLASTAGARVMEGVESFAECTSLCSAERRCQFATYDYTSKKCTVRIAVAGDPFSSSASDIPWVGFKALPASRSLAAGGAYVWWPDSNALAVGVQVPAKGENALDCMNACDDDRDCAGVVLPRGASRDGSTCLLIKGEVQLGTFVRTVVRTDVDRLNVTRLGMPSSLLPEWLRP